MTSKRILKAKRKGNALKKSIDTYYKRHKKLWKTNVKVSEYHDRREYYKKYHLRHRKERNKKALEYYYLYYKPVAAIKRRKRDRYYPELMKKAVKELSTVSTPEN